MSDPEPDTRGANFVLVVILAVAALVRLAWLARLGVVGDEDISQLAARGILDHGLPALPSGHLYWRSPLYHYAIAPLVASGVDWLPRLPSVCAALAITFAVARLGRLWVGTHAALVGAALFAISLPEIAVARLDRMYAAYQLTALLVIYCIFRFWNKGRTSWGWRAILALALALGVHEMAVTLAVLLLLVAVRQVGQARWLALAGLIAVGAVSAVQRAWVGWHYRAGLGRVLEPEAVQAVTPEGLAALFVQPDVLPAPLALALVACAAGGGLVLGWRSASRGSWVTRWLAALGLAAALAAAAAGHLGAGACVLILLVLQRREIFSERGGTRALLVCGGLIAVLGLGWIVGSIAHGVALQPAVYSVLGRGLGRYVRHLVLWPPFIAIPALAGAVAILVRTFRGAATDGQRFVLLTVVGVVTIRATLSSKWATRYLADLWPLWELLAGWALVGVVTWVARSLPRAWARVGALGASAALAAAALLLPGTSVRDTYGFVALRPGEPLAEELDTGPFFPDFRGAAAWLAPRLGPQDRVIATDWLTTYYYLGRVDYWIRWRGYGGQSVPIDGRPRDIYLHAEVLPDLDALLAVLRTEPVWVVAGGLELAGFDDKVDPRVRDWLASRRPEFVAQDGQTRVFRFVPGEAASAR